MRIEAIKLLKPLAYVEKLLTDVNLDFTTDGLEINGLDPANVAMVSLKIDRSAFQNYNVESKKMAVNLTQLTNILKRFKGDVTITLLENNIKFNSVVALDENRNFNRELTLSTLEEIESKKMPELKFTHEISLPAEVYSTTIKDMAIYDEKVYFSVEDKNFAIKNTLNKVSMPIFADDVKSSYSLEYLNKCLTLGISTEVKLQFAESYPLMLSYLGEQIKLQFVVAPMVD